MKDGDLWQGFMKMVKAKGPWTVWLSKVKGHATSEQVESGEVRPEDKAGNDVSDIVAGKGSKDEQKYIAEVAKLYSERNGEYQSFIQRVQSFLINIKKEETKSREERNLQAPCGLCERAKQGEHKHCTKICGNPERRRREVGSCTSEESIFKR